MSVHQWLVDIEEKLPGGGTVERRKSRKSSSNRTDNLGPSPNQDSRITNSPADVASRVVRGSVGRGTGVGGRKIVFRGGATNQLTDRQARGCKEGRVRRTLEGGERVGSSIQGFPHFYPLGLRGWCVTRTKTTLPTRTFHGCFFLVFET